jgi:Rrf2 family cysteine metabolism transcriptional repressor
MKLSTKGRYAARAMVELAMAYGTGPVRLSEIAEKQQISVRYLERMMNAMVTVGLVRSTRGQHGGFNLSKPPEEIRLGQVIQAVEGSLTPVECVDDPKLCHRCGLCVTREIWKTLKEAIDNVLDSVTLEDMVEMQQKNLHL